MRSSAALASASPVSTVPTVRTNRNDGQAAHRAASVGQEHVDAENIRGWQQVAR